MRRWHPIGTRALSFADRRVHGAGRASVKAVLSQVDVEIVRRSGQATGFVVLSERWVVERALAWLNRCRRLSEDWACLNQ